MVDEGEERSKGTATHYFGALLIMLGTVLLGLAGGWPKSWLGWLALVLGALLVAAASLPILDRVVTWVRELVGWVWARVLVVGLLVVVMIVAAGLIQVGARIGPPLVDRSRIWLSGCPHPPVIRVLATPDTLETARELADAYEQATADANYGCPTASLHVYDALWEDAQEALKDGWTGDHVKTLGTRPDVWLPGPQVSFPDELETLSNGQLTRVTTERVAWSPIVLAAPTSLLPDRLRRTEPTWQEVLRVAAQRNLDVVRPDPTLSPVGLLATAAIYADVGAVGVPYRARDIELLLGRALDRTRFPLADDVDLLCHARTSALAASDPLPNPALVVSEQAMIRFNAGKPLGRQCGGHTSLTAHDLVAVYPSGTASLDFLLARPHWVDEPETRKSAVAGFVRWLRGAAGKGALLESGLRPFSFPVGDPVSERYGALPGGNKYTTTLTANPEEVRDTYQAVGRPGRVLMAVDTSGSMGAGPPGQTNFDVAVTAVTSVSQRVGERDQFGLWAFPGDGAAVRRLVRLRSATQPRAVLDALRRIRPAGDTPLYDTIAEGVDVLSRAGDDHHNKPDGHNEWVTALVVLTDGADNTSGRDLSTLLTEVRGEGVRVYVVAIGEMGCSGKAVAAVAESTGGWCYGTDIDSLDTTVTGLFDVLWSVE